MMYPDDLQLAQFRADLAQVLLDTCTIQKAVLVSDGAGGQKRGVQIIASSVACLVSKPRPAGNDSDRGLNTRVSVRTITLLHDAPIDRDCQIVYAGDTYEIWDLVKDGAPLISREAQIKRIS